MFNQAQKQRIADAVHSKSQILRACPVCGNSNWMIGDGLSVFTIQPDASGVTLGGPMMPCVSLICDRCGNTHFLNVFVFAE